MRHEPRQVGVDLLELVLIVVEDVRHCDSSAQEGWMSPFLSASSQSVQTVDAWCQFNELIHALIPYGHALFLAIARRGHELQAKGGRGASQGYMSSSTG